MIRLIIDTIGIFCATVGFAIIFNIPRKELLYCGYCGILGWITYELLYLRYDTIVAPVLVGAFLAASLSRKFSYIRKNPATIYVIPAIVPMAPGYDIYRTMYYTISGEIMPAFASGLRVLQYAGAISVGISLSFSISNNFFNGNIKKIRKK